MTTCSRKTPPLRYRGLWFCCSLLALVAACSSDDSPTASSAGWGGRGMVGLAATVAEPPPSSREITISAIGDCTLGSEHRTFDRVLDSHGGDPSYPFSGVAEVLRADDLTIANLEGTLTDEPRRRDKRVTFRGKPEHARMLAEGSVELVDVANNHSHDCGGHGFDETLTALSRANVAAFGRDMVDRRVVGGIEVINLGFMGGEADNLERVPRQVAELKQPDNLVIVSFHWGGEGFYQPNTRQYELGRATIAAGADLVLGHHPHVLQGIESYRGRRIVYSLGNFVFGGDSNPEDTDSIIYQARFALRDGRVVATGERIIAVSISSAPKQHTNVNNYRPVVLEGAERRRVLDKVARLSKALAPPFGSKHSGEEHSGEEHSPQEAQPR